MSAQDVGRIAASTGLQKASNRSWGRYSQHGYVVKRNGDGVLITHSLVNLWTDPVDAVFRNIIDVIVKEVCRHGYQVVESGTGWVKVR